MIFQHCPLEVLDEEGIAVRILLIEVRRDRARFVQSSLNIDAWLDRSSVCTSGRCLTEDGDRTILGL